MRIGELSRRTGVSVRMLRHYEDEQMLAPARRANGYRDYGPAEEATVRQIQLLGAAGMTLPSIRKFLPCSLDQRSTFEPCDELKALLLQQIAAVDDRRLKLLASRAALTDLLTSFEASTPSA